MDLCLATEWRPGPRIFQAVVVTGQGGCGRDADIRSGGRTDRGGGVYIWDGDRDIITWWEDTVANITLGTDTNATLAYAPGLEHHHPIISMFMDLEGQL